jgi:hypothetical protein
MGMKWVVKKPKSITSTFNSDTMVSLKKGRDLHKTKVYSNIIILWQYICRTKATSLKTGRNRYTKCYTKLLIRLIEILA